MRVSLIGDTTYPNVAFQKISAYHKSKGDTIGLNLPNPDIVYLSCIFSWNKSTMLGKAAFYNSCGIQTITGGSGIDVKSKLDWKIEIQEPDQDLYSHLDYSFGFMTRGCIRKCSFCIVPEKEGHLRFEGFDWVKKDKVIFYDNNFLAFTQHEEILKCISRFGWKVCFNQGLDIRLVTADNAKLLADIDYRSLNFKVPRLYFAFDNRTIEMEQAVRKGVALLVKAGIKPSNLMFYTLYGKESSELAFESLVTRYNILKELGIKCYPMNFRKGDKRYWKCHKFARYVIRRYDEFLTFDQYCEGLK